MELHAAGQSLMQIAGQFKVGKATVHAVVKAARTAAQAPAPTTPTKPTRTIRKAVAGRAIDDMADGPAL